MTNLYTQLAEIDDGSKQIGGAVEKRTRQHRRIDSLARRIGFKLISFTSDFETAARVLIPASV